MTDTSIRELFHQPPTETLTDVSVSGWVRTVRDSKAFGFIELNDGTYFKNLQIVLEDGMTADFANALKVTLGTGVGGGIVINGRPWSGFHGVGSEIGHIPMDIGGVPCTCGNEGCLERYCSATAIIRMGKQILQQHPESMMMEMVGGDPEKLTAKIVFDAARELDNAAMKVFTTYVDYLAKACYTIIAFLDPEVIVLGGGVSKAGSFLLDAVRARVPKYLLFKTLPYSRIELARLGADAGMIGAAMLGKHA